MCRGLRESLPGLEQGLHELVPGRVRHREHGVDDGLQPPRLEERQRLMPERLGERPLLLERPGPQHGAHPAQALGEHQPEVHLAFHPAEQADGDHAPPRGRHLQVLPQILRPDGVEDHVHAPRREGLHALDEAPVARLDPMLSLLCFSLQPRGCNDVLIGVEFVSSPLQHPQVI